MMTKVHTCLAFFVVYFIYSLTLYGSVPGGDSGELVAESCQAGTPHPPGYPLHTLLSMLFQRLSIPRLHFQYSFDDSSLWYVDVDWNPTVGWKLNNMCAMFAALAAALIGNSCAKLLSFQQQLSIQNTTGAKSELPSGGFSAPLYVTAAMYAFSPLVWEYSIGSEVFALNNMLCAALINLTITSFRNLIEIHLLARDTKDGVPGGNDAAVSTTAKMAVVNAKISRLYRGIVLGAFVCGLVLTNQHTSALLVLFLVPFMIMVVCGVFAVLPGYIAAKPATGIKSGPSTSLLLWSAISFLLGFLPPYSYLFFASSDPKPGSWGDMTSMEGLLRHILRSEYGTFQLGGVQGREDVWQRIVHYVLHVQKSTCNAGIPLALCGFLWMLWHNHYLTRSNTPTVKPSGSVPTGTGGKGKRKHERSGSSVAPSSGSYTNTPKLISYSSNPIVLCLVAAFTGYVLLWHGVLSNLPLDSPMPYAVHSRFWMQPDLFIALFAGVGVGALSTAITSLYGVRPGDKSITGIAIKGCIDAIFVAVVFKLAVFDRFLLMNRNENEYPYLYRMSDNPYEQRGRTLQEFKGHSLVSIYGRAILDSLPENALLASHTDMDWNAVRYLQKCESAPESETTVGTSTSTGTKGLREDVVHVSFQLMPYPWFKHQQKPLYPTVSFPDPFKGISTSKLSEGNAMLIYRFFDLNAQHLVTIGQERKSPKERPAVFTHQNVSSGKVAGGIFVDMQAISDVDIEAGGIWRKKYALIPWGLTFRVIPALSIKKSASYHRESYRQLSMVRGKFPHFSSRFRDKFDPGSWEWAAMSITHDAQYQFALNLLTYSIALQKGADVQSLLLILDRLLTASVMLQDLHTVTDNDNLDTPYVPLSFPRFDLHKNAALSWLRLLGVSQICSKPTVFTAMVDALTANKDNLLNHGRIRELLSAHDDSEQLLETEEPEVTPPMEMDRTQLFAGGATLTPELIQSTAAATITSYVKNYPKDKDVETFKKSLKSLIELED